MKLIRMYRVAWRSIVRNKMRSFLTSLGIIIGVSSVIVMVALGQGSTRQIKSNIASMGTNMIMIRDTAGRSRGVSMGAGSRSKLTYDDVTYLKENATLLSNVSAHVRANGQVIGGIGNWNTSIEGVDPPYFSIRKWVLGSGTLFTERDLTSRRKVCILGKTVADELFPETDPVGKRIRINNTPFTIVGVMESKGENSFGQDQDDIIFMPSTTALYRIAGGTNIQTIYASAVSEDKVEEAIEEVEELMRKAHGIYSSDDDDFVVHSQAELTEMFTSTAKTMTMLLAAIAGVSLVVGGIGIMNIMLVSVTERTREIGIRLSVGARGRDVLLQFLTEAVTLSLCGGLVGVLLAFAMVWVSNHLLDIPAYASPHVILISVGFSAVVGMFFGWYPARKASRLHPIDALRYE